MSTLHVVTWNILHRVHAVNWAEDQAASFPDERVRITALSARVLQFMDDGADVVVLQEASGDALAELRRTGGPALEIHHHAYARVPRLHRPGPMPLVDASEHLVAITRRGRVRGVRGETFSNDPGKGFIAVTLEDAIVVGTHVSFGEKGVPQLAQLGELARGTGTTVVVAGDINAPADAFARGLGEGFVLSNLDGQQPTRVGAGRSRSSTIDHVAVMRGAVEDAVVLDGAELSDHRPVRARVACAVTAPSR